MAKMIPDFVSPSCKSDAEKRLFKRLQKEVSDKFYVLHSLGMPKHTNKIWGEADFVVIGPPGILCIEVKGGQVEYANGKWYFTNRQGQTNSKLESPMDQAKSCMLTLRNRLREAFGRNSKIWYCNFGYSAFFMDQVFDRKNLEWDLERVSDVTVIPEQSLEVLLNKHFVYSEKENLRIYDKANYLSPTLIEDVRKFCRNDYEAVLPLGIQISSAHKKLIKFTDSQIRIVDQFKTERLCVTGGAGTGKTIIAIHKARRHCANGQRVLFLCFNALLAKFLSQQISLEGLSDIIHVSTLHALCLKTIKEAGMEGDIRCDKDLEPERYYKEVLPDLFIKAFCQNKDESPFDILIVDEGQDLRKCKKYVEVIDWLLVGGLENGRWAWFEDDRQSIFNFENSDSDLSIEDYASSVLSLEDNCRNTNPIATFVGATTLTKSDRCFQEEGPKVRHEYYKDNDEQRRLLNASILDLLRDGIPSSDIVIVSACPKGRSIASILDNSNQYQLQELKHSPIASKGKIGYVTAGAFKGLESSVVIVTDVDSLELGKSLRRLYVAMTRANVVLVVLMAEELKSEYQKRVCEWVISEEKRIR